MTNDKKGVKTMDTEDCWHLGGGLLLVIVSLWSLVFECALWFSALIAIILCLYIVLLLIECAHRSKNSKPTNEKIFKLPNRGWALLLVLFLVCSNVLSFANIYIKSDGITYEEDMKLKLITDKLDAVYFSAVTVSTLGYGDFTPNQKGRKFVVFHLGSGPGQSGLN